MGTAASMATLRNIALQELTQPEDGSDLETLKDAKAEIARIKNLFKANMQEFGGKRGQSAFVQAENKERRTTNPNIAAEHDKYQDLRCWVCGVSEPITNTCKTPMLICKNAKRPYYLDKNGLLRKTKTHTEFTRDGFSALCPKHVNEVDGDLAYMAPDVQAPYIPPPDDEYGALSMLQAEKPALPDGLACGMDTLTDQLLELIRQADSTFQKAVAQNQHGGLLFLSNRDKYRHLTITDLARMQLLYAQMIHFQENASLARMGLLPTDGERTQQALDKAEEVLEKALETRIVVDGLLDANDYGADYATNPPTQYLLACDSPKPVEAAVIIFPTGTRWFSQFKKGNQIKKSERDLQKLELRVDVVQNNQHASSMGRAVARHINVGEHPAPPADNNAVSRNNVSYCPTLAYNSVKDQDRIRDAQELHEAKSLPHGPIRLLVTSGIDLMPQVYQFPMKFSTEELLPVRRVKNLDAGTAMGIVKRVLKRRLLRALMTEMRKRCVTAAHLVDLMLQNNKFRGTGNPISRGSKYKDPTITLRSFQDGVLSAGLANFTRHLDGLLGLEHDDDYLNDNLAARNVMRDLYYLIRGSFQNGVEDRLMTVLRADKSSWNPAANPGANDLPEIALDEYMAHIHPKMLNLYLRTLCTNQPQRTGIKRGVVLEALEGLEIAHHDRRFRVWQVLQEIHGLHWAGRLLSNRAWLALSTFRQRGGVVALRLAPLTLSEATPLLKLVHGLALLEALKRVLVVTALRKARQASGKRQAVRITNYALAKRLVKVMWKGGYGSLSEEDFRLGLEEQGYTGFIDRRAQDNHWRNRDEERETVDEKTAEKSWRDGVQVLHGLLLGNDALTTPSTLVHVLTANTQGLDYYTGEDGVERVMFDKSGSMWQVVVPPIDYIECGKELKSPSRRRSKEKDPSQGRVIFRVGIELGTNKACHFKCYDSSNDLLRAGDGGVALLGVINVKAKAKKLANKLRVNTREAADQFAATLTRMMTPHMQNMGKLSASLRGGVQGSAMHADKLDASVETLTTAFESMRQKKADGLAEAVTEAVTTHASEMREMSSQLMTLNSDPSSLTGSVSANLKTVAEQMPQAVQKQVEIFRMNVKAMRESALKTQNESFRQAVKKHDNIKNAKIKRFRSGSVVDKWKKVSAPDAGPDECLLQTLGEMLSPHLAKVMTLSESLNPEDKTLLVRSAMEVQLQGKKLATQSGKELVASLSQLSRRHLQALGELAAGPGVTPDQCVTLATMAGDLQRQLTIATQEHTKATKHAVMAAIAAKQIDVTMEADRKRKEQEEEQRRLDLIINANLTSEQRQNRRVVEVLRRIVLPINRPTHSKSPRMHKRARKALEAAGYDPGTPKGEEVPSLPASACMAVTHDDADIALVKVGMRNAQVGRLVVSAAASDQLKALATEVIPPAKVQSRHWSRPIWKETAHDNRQDRFQAAFPLLDPYQCQDSIAQADSSQLRKRQMIKRAVVKITAARKLGAAGADAVANMADTDKNNPKKVQHREFELGHTVARALEHIFQNRYLVPDGVLKLEQTKVKHVSAVLLQNAARRFLARRKNFALQVRIIIKIQAIFRTRIKTIVFRRKQRAARRVQRAFRNYRMRLLVARSNRSQLEAQKNPSASKNTMYIESQLAGLVDSTWEASQLTKATMMTRLSKSPNITYLKAAIAVAQRRNISRYADALVEAKKLLYTLVREEDGRRFARYGAARVLQRFYRNVVKVQCTVNVLNIAKNVLRTRKRDKLMMQQREHDAKKELEQASGSLRCRYFVTPRLVRKDTHERASMNSPQTDHRHGAKDTGEGGGQPTKFSMMLLSKHPGYYFMLKSATQPKWQSHRSMSSQWSLEHGAKFSAGGPPCNPVDGSFRPAWYLNPHFRVFFSLPDELQHEGASPTRASRPSRLEMFWKGESDVKDREWSFHVLRNSNIRSVPARASVQTLHPSNHEILGRGVHPNNLKIRPQTEMEPKTFFKANLAPPGVPVLNQTLDEFGAVVSEAEEEPKADSNSAKSKLPINSVPWPLSQLSAPLEEYSVPPELSENDAPAGMRCCAIALDLNRPGLFKRSKKKVHMSKKRKKAWSKSWVAPGNPTSFRSPKRRSQQELGKSLSRSLARELMVFVVPSSLYPSVGGQFNLELWSNLPVSRVELCGPERMESEFTKYVDAHYGSNAQPGPTPKTEEEEGA